MKNKKVELIKWQPKPDETLIEIDWPKVHKTIGSDHLQWLLKQSTDACQLILERNEEQCKLIAEFYNDRTLARYHLMWTK